MIAVSSSVAATSCSLPARNVAAGFLTASDAIALAAAIVAATWLIDMVLTPQPGPA